MRVLKPGTVEDVQFEAEDGPPAVGSPSGGWKMTAAGQLRAAGPDGQGRAAGRRAARPAAAIQAGAETEG